jgi:hypothetical protein
MRAFVPEYCTNKVYVSSHSAISALVVSEYVYHGFS